MAINGRLLRTSKQMGLGNNNGGQNQYYSLMNNYSLRFKCLNKGRQKVVVVATKAVGTAVVSEPITTQNWKTSDVSLVADNVSDLIFQNLKNLLKQMPQKLHHLQSSIEKV